MWSTSQRSTTWWSDGKHVRKEAGLIAQSAVLYCCKLLFNPLLLQLKFGECCAGFLLVQWNPSVDKIQNYIFSAEICLERTDVHNLVMEHMRFLFLFLVEFFL